MYGVQSQLSEAKKRIKVLEAENANLTLQLGQQFNSGKETRPDDHNAAEIMQMAKRVSITKRLGKFYFAFFSSASPSRMSFAELTNPPTFHYDSPDRYRTQESEELGEVADLKACIASSIEDKFVTTEVFITEVNFSMLMSIISSSDIQIFRL